MDSSLPQAQPPPHAPVSASASSTLNIDQLPPEAIALATRMFDAARKGDAESKALLGQALEHGLPANLTNGKGDSLIMLASYHGHVSLVKLLLFHDADPNRLNDRGQSPLAGVVFKNERECIEALLDGGADPEIGEPSALDACRIFKQEEYEEMFRKQIESLKATGDRATNGMP